MKTFVDDDKMGLTGFAENLWHFCDIERDLAEGSLVVSLNAPFGSGKSWFLEMFEDYLSSATDEGAPRSDVLRLNAWKSDYFDDPVVAIAASLCEYFDGFRSGKVKLTSSLKKLAAVVYEGGSQVIQQKTGLNFEQIDAKSDASLAGVMGQVGSQLYSEFKRQKHLTDKVVEEIEAFVSKREKPLVILVDELDRARPDYAVRFIEAMKHYFSAKNVVYVLAVDVGQLEASVRCLYGEVNFSEYYRKFVQRNVDLPKLEGAKISGYVTAKVTDFFDAQKRKHNFAVDMCDRSRIEHMVYLFKLFDLSPRQFDEVMRVLAHYFYASEGRRIVFGYVMAAIIQTCLLVANREEQKRFIAEKHSLKSYIDFFQGRWRYVESEGGDGSWLRGILLMIVSDRNTQDSNTRWYVTNVLNESPPATEKAWSERIYAVWRNSNQVIGMGNDFQSPMSRVCEDLMECKTLIDRKQ